MKISKDGSRVEVRTNKWKLIGRIVIFICMGVLLFYLNSKEGGMWKHEPPDDIKAETQLISNVVVYILLLFLAGVTIYYGRKLILNKSSLILTPSGLSYEDWNMGIVEWKDIEKITLETREPRRFSFSTEYYIQVKPRVLTPYLERKHGEGGRANFVLVEWEISARQDDLEVDPEELYAQLKKFHVKYRLTDSSKSQSQT